VNGLDEPLPPDPPTSFQIGFASSTGDGTNIHESRAVRIETIEPLPLYTLAKTHEGELVAGGTGDFRLSVALRPPPEGGVARAPVTLSDRLPAGVRVADDPSGDGWDCSETVVGSRRVRCTYPVDLDRPVNPGTSLPAVTVPVRIDPDVDGELVNVARLTGSEILEPLRAEDRFTVRRRADLGVLKRARPTQVAAGGLVGFELVVANQGPSDARDVVLDDTLPAGLEAVEANPSDGRCTRTPLRVHCELGTIRADSSKQVLAAARSTGALGTLRNVVEVTSREPDPDASDNRAEATVEVTGEDEVRPPPSLEVSKRAAAPSVRVGEPLRYTVRVTNRGTRTARDIVLTDTNTLPMRVLAVRPSRGSCDRLEAAVVCRLGDLPAGASATVRLDDVILRAGQSENVAGVLAPGAELERRLATASVRVIGGAALRLRKSASRAAAPLGAVVGFRITVRSLGPEPLERIRVCDRLPRQLTLAGGRRGRTACWRLEGLQAGRSHSFRVRAGVVAPGTRVRNVATAVAANAARVRAGRTIRVPMRPPPVTG
jgi:uncharacterized repeat protein (TIGR01451 family)